MPLTQLTPYQSQYDAWQLTRRTEADSVEAPASTLVNSQVALIPHQVEAALFACQNPLTRGVILADEVGLGKTIEAGLVISQRWAEMRCKVLLTAPPLQNSRLELYGLVSLIDDRASKRLFARREPPQPWAL